MTMILKRPGKGFRKSRRTMQSAIILSFYARRESGLLPPPPAITLPHKPYLPKWRAA